MRVIHIVENLDKGAVENWLVNVFIESRKYNPHIEWTFFCILGKEGRLDDIVRENSGTIIYSPYNIKQKFKFLDNLRRTLKNGKYDILHSHHDYLSGFYLLASLGLKFKYRILHIHNQVAELPTGRRNLQKIFLKIFRKVDLIINDKIVGIAEDTVDFFLKGECPNKRRVLYYGFDFDKFHGEPKQDIRKLLMLDSEALLILFVGRLDNLKNSQYIVDILYYLNKQSQNIHALFIGEGSEKEAICCKAQKLGLENRIHMLGWRDDVPEIMKQSDVFIFPRVEYEKEGLGKVVVEAQAAGMCTLISRGIPSDAIVIENIVKIIPLNDNPEEWASGAFELLARRNISRAEALQVLERSKFALKNGALNLLKLYE